MEATELRIGNIIHHPQKGGSGYVYVNHRTINDISSTNNEVGYKPIPLTEEWLVKFGFKKYKKLHSYLDPHLPSPFYEKNDFSLFKYDFGFRFFTDLEKEVYIKYIHQLQNLYFALTGEELRYGP